MENKTAEQSLGKALPMCVIAVIAAMVRMGYPSRPFWLIPIFALLLYVLFDLFLASKKNKADKIKETTKNGQE